MSDLPKSQSDVVVTITVKENIEPKNNTSNLPVNPVPYHRYPEDPRQKSAGTTCGPLYVSPSST